MLVLTIVEIIAVNMLDLQETQEDRQANAIADHPKINIVYIDIENKEMLAHAIDRICRWLFPLSYFGLLGVLVWIYLM